MKRPNLTVTTRALVHKVLFDDNRISIDGVQSTNDTVLLLANGAAGNAELGAGHADWTVFCDAVRTVCLDLAMKIVEDGEGISKGVTVRVTGARTPADAENVARSVSNSLLVKTAWYGGDPNWGRVIDAVGFARADVQEQPRRPPSL